MGVIADNRTISVGQTVGLAEGHNGIITDVNTSLAKCERFGTRAPGPTDDATQGFDAGSRWDDIVHFKSYRCYSAAAGAADWREIGGGVPDPAGHHNTILSVANDETWDFKTLRSSIYGDGSSTDIPCVGAVRDAIEGLNGSDIGVDSNVFTGNLSIVDNNVQAALETLDALDAVPDATYTDAGDVLIADGNGGYAWQAIDIPDAGLPGEVWYLRLASGEPGISYMETSPAPIAQGTGAEVTADGMALVNWTTQAGAGLSRIPAGIAYVRLSVGSSWTYQSHQDLRVSVKVYKRSMGDVRTLLFQTNQTPNLPQAETPFLLTATITNDIDIAPTDRLYLEIIGHVSGAGVNPVLAYATGTGTTGSCLRIPTTTHQGGSILGPLSVTDGRIPQWDGTSGRVLKDGLSVVTTVGAVGADTAVPTEQAVREAIADIDIPEVPEALSDLSDVDFDPAPQTGNLLRFNGTHWVPVSTETVWVVTWVDFELGECGGTELDVILAPQI